MTTARHTPRARKTRLRKHVTIHAEYTVTIAPPPPHGAAWTYCRDNSVSSRLATKQPELVTCTKCREVLAQQTLKKLTAEPCPHTWVVWDDQASPKVFYCETCKASFVHSLGQRR